uniref:G-protein coupled receptors family 2 profile 2 domain-containing protein n=1 Tax=Arcella intermedia TaxID=1963864 RepID=A0A6B2LA28_9EUKA
MYLCITICIGQTAFTVAISNPSNIIDNTSICVPLGAVVHYFLLSNFFWCFCIAFNFYQMIVKRNSGTRQLEKYYHLIGWGVPCISVMICAGFEKYGRTTRDSSASCYINDTVFVFATFFLPGLILLAANAVLFFFVASEIHGTLAKAPDSEQREKTKEFRVLISIFVTVGLSWIFAFFNAIFEQIPVLNYIVLVLMTIFTPLQGFFIFAAYCLNKKVQVNWMTFFSRCFPCCAVEGSIGSKQTTGTANTRGGSTAYSQTASGNSSNTRSYASRN